MAQDQQVTEFLLRLRDEVSKNAATASQSVSKLDRSMNSAAQTARNFAGALGSNRIYAIGGRNANNQCLKTVEEYDPAKNTWTPKADMPTGRHSLGAAVGSVSGTGGPFGKSQIFAIGGICPSPLNTVEGFDPKKGTLGTWTTNWPPMTKTRTDLGVIGAFSIFAIGGSNGSISLDTNEKLQP